MEPFDESKCHAVVYVGRDGHATRPVGSMLDYPTLWRTWEGEIAWVPSAAWRDYAGAWGAVGPLAFTTGPLGPSFKRDRDELRLVSRDGRTYVVLHRS
jgi:hypothetical protein